MRAASCLLHRPACALSQLHVGARLLRTTPAPPPALQQPHHIDLTLPSYLSQRGDDRHCCSAAKNTGTMFSSVTRQEESSRTYDERGALCLTLTVTSKDTAAARGAGGGSRALRLDAFLAAALASGQAGSRSKAQGAIRSGGVTVNGRVALKASATLATGDCVQAVLEPAPLLQALPEPIPLNVVYEDEYLMVINKPAGMAIHVSAGHHTGTLVNALLYHCGLPGVSSTDPDSDVSVLMGSPDADAGSNSRGGGDAQGGKGLGYSLDGLRALVGGVSRGEAGGAVFEELLGAGEGAVRHDGVVGGVDLEGGDDGDDDEDGGEIEGDRQEGEKGRIREMPSKAVGSKGERRESGVESGLLERGSGSNANSIDESSRNSSHKKSTNSSNSSSSSTGISDGSRSGSCSTAGVLRPGIVHRLDIGTSGLVVVAKREAAQRHLAAQFKARTVSRIYTSISLGCPAKTDGRVMTNIDRDTSDRKRMAAYPYGGGRGRTAASNYWMLSEVAGGGASVVEWKLETGRTHQIRVHARHIGHPLLCDTTYSGGGAAAVNALARNKSSRLTSARQVMASLSRPALHARTLAFDHPATGERLSFEAGVPEDMQQALETLEGTGWA